MKIVLTIEDLEEGQSVTITLDGVNVLEETDYDPDPPKGTVTKSATIRAVGQSHD